MEEVCDLYTPLSLFFRAFRIPVSIYQDGRAVRSYTSLIFEPDPAWHYMRHVITPPDSISFAAWHGAMYGMTEAAQTGQQLLVGPVPSAAYTTGQGDAILRDLGASLSMRGRLRCLLTRTQTMSRRHFISALNLLYYLVNRRSPVNRYDVNYLEAGDLASDAPPPGNLRTAVVHDSQQVERQVLTAIEHGSTDELEQLYYQIITSDLSEGSTAGSEIRHYKNIAIGSVVLASRAAIRGGLAYDDSLSMSDYFICEIEAFTDEQKLLFFLREIFLFFAQAVERQKKPAGCGVLTKRIIEDVHLHLTGPLSVRDVAGRLNQSVSNVSHTFSREMGCTLQHYISRIKVEKARYMLDSGQFTLLEIAMELGFSSQPHFQSVFRKYTGMTPKEYQRQKDMQASD